MTCFVAILIWISYIVGSLFCEAACFRLLGGTHDREGFLQINVNNVWQNVCLNDDLHVVDIRRDICHPIYSNTKGASIINEPLLYENKPGEGNITINNLTCQATMEATDACPKFIICCQDEPISKQLSHCSSNWLETEYCYHGKVVGIHWFLKYNDNQNVRRAWTSSAFKDSCKTNTSYSVTIANKLNKCLRTVHNNSDNSYALIEGDNCKWTTEIKCENAQTFELLQDKTESMDGLHCVTVEVQNGTRNISIAHCFSYLPAVCLVGKQVPGNETERPAEDKTKYLTKNIRSLTTPSSNEKENVLSYLAILAIVPFAFLVFILVFIARYHIRKSRKRLIERQRPNSVQNHTYGRGRVVEESIEETYNLINDFELKDFKPELPARGQHNQILVLDDYSMPPDAIPQKTESDEYFVTYDDPIRSLVKQHNEADQKQRYDINHLSETRVESFKRKFQDDKGLCSSTYTDKSSLVLNEEHVEFNRIPPSETLSLNRTGRFKKFSFETKKHSYKSKETNIVNFDFLDKKIASEPSISIRSENNSVLTGACESDERSPENIAADQTKTSGSLDGIALQNRVSVESSNGYTDCISKRPTKLIKQSEDSDDYEDTSNVNHEQLCADAKPKEHLFHNHVCIDCLTPDHLKKLGIRIIPDESAYTSYNLNIPKRFSDSALELYINTAGLKKSQWSKFSSKSFDMADEENKPNENLKKSCSKDELEIFHKKQRAKEENAYFKCPRKCSLCHADSYDILGAFSKSNDTSDSENVYHKLADVRIWTPKHVRCRHMRHKST
ncbi:uncharacterized protein LOC128233480 isoform X2 [Mya arenaria]|uniref:uncharacterized protein LOC128233480 isoform X2 n=1 Tax=Mya arenaria TaxID=6604 RepID=UPI0022E57D6E|nr:uncharacterized protein LOC128233480 isoform X2 [Mya arenaria]